MKNFLKTAAAAATGLALMSSAVYAEKVLRIQSVLPATADEVHMLNEFGKDVAALTGGSLTIEVLPAGAVVGPRDIMDAVDAGLVEGGFAWTHYWGGKHPAANLFGAPVAGADTIQEAQQIRVKAKETSGQKESAEAAQGVFGQYVRRGL